jgi:hypothetical protein
MKISPERTKELDSSIRKSSLAEQIIIASYLVNKVSPELISKLFEKKLKA